jgi:hypothetical protein
MPEPRITQEELDAAIKANEERLLAVTRAEQYRLQCIKNADAFNSYIPVPVYGTGHNGGLK